MGQRQNSLSDNVVVVRRIHLEAAVVGPQVYRSSDTRDTTLVYHLGSLCAANRELEVGILLPVTEEQWKLGEKAVVDVADKLDDRGTGVAGDTAFELRGASDERFPFVEIIFALHLYMLLAKVCSEAMGDSPQR